LEQVKNQKKKVTTQKIYIQKLTGYARILREKCYKMKKIVNGKKKVDPRSFRETRMYHLKNQTEFL